MSVRIVYQDHNSTLGELLAQDVLSKFMTNLQKLLILFPEVMKFLTLQNVHILLKMSLDLSHITFALYCK